MAASGGRSPAGSSRSATTSLCSGIPRGRRRKSPSTTRDGSSASPATRIGAYSASTASARASVSSVSAHGGRCGTSGARDASRTGTSTSSATKSARRSGSTSSTRSSTSSSRPTVPCAGRTKTSWSKLRAAATSTRTTFAPRLRRCSPIHRGRPAGRTGVRIPPGACRRARGLGRGLIEARLGSDPCDVPKSQAAPRVPHRCSRRRGHAPTSHLLGRPCQGSDP